MASPETPTDQSALTAELLTSLAGLRFVVSKDAWSAIREALPEGTDTVELPVASIHFGLDYQPVAVGIRYRAIFEAIGREGNNTTPIARIIGMSDSRQIEFTVDGSDVYEPPRSASKSYDGPLSTRFGFLDY